MSLLTARSGLLTEGLTLHLVAKVQDRLEHLEGGVAVLELRARESGPEERIDGLLAGKHPAPVGRAQRPCVRS